MEFSILERSLSQHRSKKLNWSSGPKATKVTADIMLLDWVIPTLVLTDVLLQVGK